MLACVIFGSLAGVFSGIAGLRLGLSFQAAFAVYLGVSLAAMVVLPLVCLSLRRLACMVSPAKPRAQARLAEARARRT